MNKKHLLSLILILAIGIIVYANSFSGDFVWDASLIVKNNPYIQAININNIKHIITAPFFDTNEQFNFYRPLTMVLFMFDYAIWKTNPFGYHLTNFILHYINACLVYMVLFYLTRRYILTLFLSLIFIAHPSATEAITYIASRSDPLSLMFLTISFLFIHFWRGTPAKKSYYIFSVISFIFACFSKETAVTFPVFLFLYCIITNKTGQYKLKTSIFVVTPYFIIAFVYLLARYFILQNSGGLFFVKSNIGMANRVITAPAVISKYIAAFLIPRTFVMEEPVTFYTSILNPAALLSIILLLSILVIIIRFYKSGVMVLGALWFLIFILPVSGIFSIVPLFYNHWLYIPCLGLLLTLSGLIIKLDKTLENFPHGRAARYTAQFMGVILLLACCILTIKQNPYFNDDITVYQETLKKYPNSARLYCNLGLAYEERGLTEEAGECYKRAIAINPQDTKAIYNLGVIYDKKGLVSEAMANYKEVIKIDSDYINAYNNLGVLYAEKREYAKAKLCWEKALAIRPDYKSPAANLERLRKIE